MDFEQISKQIDRLAPTFTPEQKRDLFLKTAEWAEADLQQRLLMTDPPIMSAKDAFPLAMKVRRQNGAITGLSTGYRNLDKVTLGFDPGEFILFFGNQNRGKTMYAQSILHNMALQNIPSLFVSIEMPIAQVMNRFIDMQRFTPGPEEFAANLSVFFYPDEMDYTPDILKEYIRFMIEHHEIKIVVVDHLSVLPPIHADRRISMGEWARLFQSWTKQLNIPIILLHHTRKLQDDDAEPSVADIAETQSLANLATQIHGIWRVTATDNEYEKRIVKVRVLKNKYKNLGGCCEFYIRESYKLDENVAYYSAETAFNPQGTPVDYSARVAQRNYPPAKGL